MRLLKRPGQKLACQDLVELVTEYLEDALPRRQHRRFEDHIDLCDGCDTYLEQYRETLLLTGTLTEDDIEPAARTLLLEAFRDWHDGAE